MFDPISKVTKGDAILLGEEDSSLSSGGKSKSIDIECYVPMDAPPANLLPSGHYPKDKSPPSPSWKSYLKELGMDALSLCLTLPILTIFTLIALLNTAKRHFDLKHSTSNSIHQRRLQEMKVDEEITRDETYYAKRWGYDCQEHKAITEDGFILKMYRFSPQHAGPTNDNRKPVLLGHGLFQCSGDFILNEKDSIVFALVDQGYDVWTGNNRGVGSLEHVSLSSDDPYYWDWGLKELGVYDLPTMLDYVRAATGHEKVGYIGHSQGNAQAFIALSLQPELAKKMSCFVALAPAVISGSLTRTFPLRYLIHMNRKTFSILFGRKAFLGMMTTAQHTLPPTLMCTLAYSVFCYLFAWWDHHWVQRRKVKYFQYTPRPVSTRLLLDWLDGWGRQGVCLHINTTTTTKGTTNKEEGKIPLAIIYGASDYLVDGASFVRSFEGYENHGLMEDEWRQLGQHRSPPMERPSFPTLDLVHVERIPGYEHMDTIWAHDNTMTTYPVIFSILKTAKWTPSVE